LTPPSTKAQSSTLRPRPVFHRRWNAQIDPIDGAAGFHASSLAFRRKSHPTQPNRCSMQHSVAFAAVRDRLLRELDDADRLRLTGLFGSMTDPLPDPSPALVALLAAIVALEPADRVKLARWVRTYVTRWGQVPSAASRQVQHPERH
jgi:hypothetical protein